MSTLSREYDYIVAQEGLGEMISAGARNVMQTIRKWWDAFMKWLSDICKKIKSFVRDIKESFSQTPPIPKTELKKASEEKDITKLRSMLTDALKIGNAQWCLDFILDTGISKEELFEPEEQPIVEVFAGQYRWNREYFDAQIAELMNNFNEKLFMHLIEVSAYLRCDVVIWASTRDPIKKPVFITKDKLIKKAMDEIKQASKLSDSEGLSRVAEASHDLSAYLFDLEPVKVHFTPEKHALEMSALMKTNKSEITTILDLLVDASARISKLLIHESEDPQLTEEKLKEFADSVSSAVTTIRKLLEVNL